MKPKVALVKDGFLPAGSENVRGRLSLPAIERLKELAAIGWDIDGYTVKKSADANTAPVIEKATVSQGKVIPDVPADIRDENTWSAHILIDGKHKEIGMRTVCNGPCGSSLTNCWCEKSRVWDGRNNEVVVEFKPRTSPLPNKRW